MSDCAGLPRRDRLILGVGLLGVALLAWAYLIYEAHRMSASGVCECMRMKMAGPDGGAWPPGTLLPLFLMWCVMMVAMMVPSTMPMVLTFAGLERNRRRLGRPFVPTAVFVCGYIAIWCAFSVIAAVGQWVLHRQALLSASMATTNAILGGVLLIGAGVFQFTPLKRTCLTRCRGPLEFILTRWREGRGGAFRMGLEHGAFCAGCCWALMALLFVAGVMNILWVAVLTLLICLEKMLPPRWPVSFAAGVGLTFWGICLLASPFLGLAVS